MAGVTSFVEGRVHMLNHLFLIVIYCEHLLYIVNISLAALSIGYIKILKVFLSITASWPYQVARGKVHLAYWLYGRCAIALGLIATTGEIWFLVDNRKVLSFYELGHMYLTCFFGFLAIIRTLLPLFEKYGIIMERFLLSFHLIHLKHKGSYYQKIYEKVEWLSHRVVVITMFLTMLSAALYFMIPVMNNIKSGAYNDQNKTIEFALVFSYPGFNPQDHYKFVTGWNIFIVFACAILIGGIDIVMSLFIFQIIGHIEILNSTLADFPESESITVRIVNIGRNTEEVILTTAMFNKEDNDIIAKKIKRCVEHHLEIISFTDDVSEFFGPVIAFYYLFHLVAGCILLLELSAGDPASLARYGTPTAVIFGQLVVISVIFEIVNTKSEQLADTAYLMPWESMSVANQRSVCLLLRRLQTPIAVTALGITGVNVQTALSILKTSFSYFTFLKTQNH